MNIQYRTRNYCFLTSLLHHYTTRLIRQNSAKIDYSMKNAHDLFYLQIAEHLVSAAYEWVLNASQRVNNNRLKLINNS